MTKDKFQTGNMIIHIPTKTRWIVTERSEIRYEQTSFWRLKIKAYCTYHPLLKNDSRWRVNGHECFVLQDKDLSPKDKIWKVIYEKN